MADTPRKTDIQLSETTADANKRRMMDWSNVVPGIGPIVNALLKEIIPDTRMERLAAFMQYLEKRIDRIELQNAANVPEKLDLFEEGLLQASRALSDERRIYIAAVVANGLKEGPDDLSETRHFIRLLNLLDDRQIILLCNYLPEYSVMGDKVADAFYEKHKHILAPPEEHTGSIIISPGEELNASMKYHLASLGFLEIQDTVGSIGHTYNKQKYKITAFGERFLRYLELGEPEE